MQRARMLFGWCVVLAGLAGCDSLLNGGQSYTPTKPRTPYAEPEPPPAKAKSADSATAQNPLGTGSSPGVVGGVKVSPPATFVRTDTEFDRRTITLKRIQVLAAALDTFRKQHKQFPHQSYGAGLSWRVELLPYLGLGVLHSRFRQNEPWDSEHNKRLLEEIPEVYRSVTRKDEKTNFLLITGPGTACPVGRAVSEKDIVDGVQNTIVMAEVADPLAQPWTKPADYKFQMESAQQDLFGLRIDCSYVVLGEIGLRRLPSVVSDQVLLALMSPAGRERIVYSQFLMNADAGVDQELIDELKANPVQRKPVLPRVDVNLPKIDPKQPGPNSTAHTLTPAVSDDLRWPVPEEKDITAATTLLKELYKDDYRASQTPAGKRSLAKKLLAQSGRVRDDVPGTYVLLTEARDHGARGGDVVSAMTAVDTLGQKFRVDPFAMRLKALETAAGLIEAADAKLMYDKAVEAARIFLDRDDFESTRKALNLAQNAARRYGNKEAIAFIASRRELLEEIKKAFDRVAPALHTLLRFPEDLAANRVVGRYVCLIKRDWAKGLPMIARGDDETLRRIALLDLKDPLAVEEQVAVADQWWDWAEKANGAEKSNMERIAARLRAGHWYLLAEGRLGSSLTKERAVKRIDESGARQEPGEKPKVNVGPKVTVDDE